MAVAATARRAALLLVLLAAGARAAPAAWPLPSPVASGWNSAGNHRFRLDVTAPPGGLVAAAVAWRRRDAFVSTADTFIVAGAANATAPLVRACYRNDSALTSTDATFFFTADAGAGSYYLYFLPFSTCEYAGGGCEYNADVSYAPRAHCADAPWWPTGAQAIAPDAVTYEAVSDFDAFTDMERLASRDEVAAFFAAAAPPPPLRALLIAESAALSARVWGSGGSAASAAGGTAAAAGGTAAPPRRPPRRPSASTPRPRAARTSRRAATQPSRPAGTTASRTSAAAATPPTASGSARRPSARPTA